MHSESPETVLTRFQSEKVENEDNFQIIRVRRKHLWEDTVRAVTKSNFWCNHSLKVHFIGEEAEDEGGPRREFFRLAVTAIRDDSGVLQDPEYRKTVSNNPLLLERGVYYCAGIVTGMCLQQGGPGLHLFVFHLHSLTISVVGGPSSSKPIPQDVADHDMKMKIENVML